MSDIDRAIRMAKWWTTNPGGRSALSDVTLRPLAALSKAAGAPVKMWTGAQWSAPVSWELDSPSLGTIRGLSMPVRVGDEDKK